MPFVTTPNCQFSPVAKTLLAKWVFSNFERGLGTHKLQLRHVLKCPCCKNTHSTCMPKRGCSVVFYGLFRSNFAWENRKVAKFPMKIGMHRPQECLSRDCDFLCLSFLEKMVVFQGKAGDRWPGFPLSTSTSARFPFKNLLGEVQMVVFKEKHAQNALLLRFKATFSSRP